MNLESITSAGAAKLEGAGEAVRRGAKGVGRGALLVRQRATEHPLLSAAVGAAVAGALWAVASGGKRSRQRRLAAGLAVLGGAVHTLSRNGQLARGMDGARKLGKQFSKWGKNQSLASFARENVVPLLQQLVPLVAARLVSARKRLSH